MQFFEKSQSSSRLPWMILMAAFLLSGIAGLVYESIWTHYLKLYLGHASYAQTLVLSVFMAGLALGSWLASRLSLSGNNMLRAYAYVEIAIGLLGLLFHRGFIIFERWSFDSVIPELGSTAAIFTFKWLAALSLVAPQAILLGMTFPLMVAGVLRSFTIGSGRVIASFYFVNSLGACIGVWLSGFFLISLVGLPGTITSAAILNLLVGLVVLVLARQRQDISIESDTASSVKPVAERRDREALLLLLCAFGTGLASFIYEISWIRMLNLVLGTTTHAFELMLGTFILGLALGSLAIRRYLDRLENPLKFLGLVQLTMAIAAAATILLYNSLFGVMGWLLQGLAKTDTGYLLFNLSSLAICVVVMLPATICAGMTLPLITHILRRRTGGEAVVGRVYAINTLGAIAGIVSVSLLLIPWLGLKWALFSGVMVDLALGLLLLAYAGERLPRFSPAYVTAALVLAIGLTVDFDPNRQLSGVYFRDNPGRGNIAELLYYRDGPTASVGVKLTEDKKYTLLTNGKPDAALRLYEEPANTDETTMVLIGALPLSVSRPIESAAVVGFGSGITSQTLLHDPGLGRLDTIEIEPRMVDAALSYRSRVANVLDDPRSHIHVEDAKTFFSTSQHQYDLIVSEPSNPWVSGVAGLFSAEYYRNTMRHLKPGGTMAQWIHIYEFNDRLLISILRAISSVFAHYQLYQLNEGDVLIIASNEPMGAPGERVFEIPNLEAELQRVNVHSVADLWVRYLGGSKLLRGWLERQPVPPNSDYFPIVDLNAVRARYLKQKATLLHDLRDAQSLINPQSLADNLLGARSDPSLFTTLYAREAASLRRHLDGEPGPVYESDRQAYSALLRAQTSLDHCLVEEDWENFLQDSLLVSRQMLFYSPPGVFADFWTEATRGRCFDAYPENIQLWLRYLRAVSTWDDAAISQLGRSYLAHLSAEREFVLLTLLAADIRTGHFGETASLLRRVAMDSSETGVNILAIRALEQVVAKQAR